MRKQRKMFQMTEQKKTKQTNTNRTPADKRDR